MSKYLEDRYLNSVLEDYFSDDQESDYQEYDLTVEEINSIFASNDIVIDEAFINARQIQDFLNKNFNPFLKMGISPSDIKLLKARSIDVGGNILNIVKAQGLNNDSKIKITEELNIFYDYIVKVLERSTIELQIPDKFDARNISKSIVVLIAVGALNTIFMTLFASLCGDPLLGIRLGAVIVAPLTEEAGKIISIKGKFDKEYFFVFNAFEFTSYVTKGLDAGIELKKMIFIRSIGVLAHFIFTLIHKFMQSNAIKKLLNPKDEKDFENKCVFLGNIIGVGLHAFFNSSKFEDIFWNRIDFLK